MAFYQRAGDTISVIYLQVIEEIAKEYAALPEPLSFEQASELLQGNAEFRRYFDLAGKRLGITATFDDTFRPPEGWKALYVSLGL